MWIVWVVMVTVLYVYTFGISTYMRNFESSVLRHGSSEKKIIALTFDDGPNPQYTTHVLDILKSYSVPGTFFIVAQNAESFPHIIHRMVSEGHSVGLHTYSHRHAWLMSPWATFTDFKRSIKAYQSIVGCSPKWFRPPWGTFNLFTYFFAKKFGLKVAYWSIEAQDWESSASASSISDKIITKARAGSIIVLHDNNGAPGAPAKTIAALPIILSELIKKGYTFVTLNQIEGGKYE